MNKDADQLKDVFRLVLSGIAQVINGVRTHIDLGWEGKILIDLTPMKGPQAKVEAL
jgi:hypothetical protein